MWHEHQHKHLVFILLITLTISLLWGCGSQTTSEAVVLPTHAELQTPTFAPEPTRSPTPAASPTPSFTLTPSHTPIPTATEEPEGVVLYYEEYAQFELIGPDNQRVLIDVFNPDALSQPPSTDDILLTTHHHYDHYQEAFVASFPGQQLNRRSGRIELPGVTITGIPSAHNAGDRLKPEGGTNYIFLIEMGGLRIAHFGDIGQEKLTEEQLDVLLPVDIAITQLRNPYSDMGMENLKGFRLMEQVQPRLVLPTHASRETLQHAAGLWSGFYSEKTSVFFTRDELNVQTQILLLGSHASANKDIHPLAEW
ncbi:MAG: MBL fold metallo-hydrolase [Chloroflexota bacterium]|nr:MBL fold metallo-hydrolase [Chloroflexota bacterium]